MSERGVARGPYRNRKKIPRQTLHNRKRKAPAESDDDRPVKERDLELELELAADLLIAPTVPAEDIIDVSITKTSTQSSDSDSSMSADDFDPTTDDDDDAAEGYDMYSSTSTSTSTIASCLPTVNADVVVPRAQMLYPGSLLTPATSTLLIRCFANQHHLTVRAKRDLLQLLHLHLPKENALPSSLYYLNKSEATSRAPSEHELTSKHHYYCGSLALLASIAIHLHVYKILSSPYPLKNRSKHSLRVSLIYYTV